MTSRSSKSNGNNRAYQNNRMTNNLMIGDFKIGAKLGQGTFSKVCQGIHMPTGEKVAIKIMSKDQIKEKSDKIRIEKEINIQKKLHHQNIVQQYAIIETESKIYIISEYCSGGELFDYIVSKRKLYEAEACRIYQQLISGLEYLHKQRICHRDLKPENLLFDSKHILKIADFGLSNDYHKGKLSTPCGSPCYAAPEMVTGKKYSGSSVDIWSSGIVLYTMVCGFLPFEDDNQNILFGKIAKGLFSLPSFLSSACKDLLKKILVTDPQKRYGFEEIKHHAWFLSINNVMGKNIFFNSPGVFIEEDVIPIDIEIIAEIYNDFHIDIDKIINDVLRNRHNKITTTYYLILKRKIRNNENSVSDISSNSNIFIKYIKSSISKMGYWNNDYNKITEHYTQLVKKFLNAISEENSISFESRNKNNRNIYNKENNNMNIITTITNIDKIDLNKIISNNKPNDYHCYTDLIDNSNNINKNKKNNLIINNQVQNGGIDIRISSLYDDKINMIPKLPINSIIDPKKENNMNKIDYLLDSEEPPTQKINESYRPKMTIQAFLQTDANNIKMNNRLIKETNNLQDAIKYNKSIIDNNNNNNLKEEPFNGVRTNENSEPKETTMSNVDRILLTEMDNIDMKNIQNSLLNKKDDLNNNIKNHSKNIQNLRNNNNDYIRMNTLYNKDDSNDNIKLNTNENINIKKEIILTNKLDSGKNTPSYKDKIELKPNNNDLSKAINGLNEDNYRDDKTNNIIKSIGKTTENSNRNSNYSNNKTSSNNENKEKYNRFNLNMNSLPSSNQIYKKLTKYSEKPDKILKFINQKKSLMTKKEDSRRENEGLENGRLLLMNKNKYKNRYSQEHNSYQNNNMNNGIPNKANGSNEYNLIKRNIYNNPNDIIYIRKKKRPKSIDDKTNQKLFNDLNYKENNNIIGVNNNSFNRKQSKENINNNNDFYFKMNNNKKNIYKNIINNKKFFDESYINTFRFKNIYNNSKLNKKNDISDFNNISNITNRKNNYLIEKIKKREKYMVLNSDLNNYTNISINKNNNKLHEHNSFDISKNMANKVNRNYIYNSIEKINKQSNNNRNIIKQNNNNYIKLNKRIKQYYRNTYNKQNIAETQYYGINNYNKNYNNNYNIDKLSNEQVMINKRINNYKIVDKIKSNSVDLPKNIINKEINDIQSLKNKRKFYLNTSVIKDKTPRKLNTNYLLDKNIGNSNNIKNKNKYYLNTMENNNYNNIINNNINKYTDEGRYLTFKDSDNSKRTNHFQKYLVPIHKRYNFSQEPERKKKYNEGFDIISPYGKENSFILSKNNNYLYNKDRNLNNLPYKNINNMNQFNNNKNLLYEKQKLINKVYNKNDNKIFVENKNNGNNMNIYCRKPFDKIKDYVEKIIENRVNIAKNSNSSNKNLICEYKEGANSINFILNISKNSGKKDYLILSSKLIKGNTNTYKLIIKKIKNQLI